MRIMSIITTLVTLLVQHILFVKDCGVRCNVRLYGIKTEWVKKNISTLNVEKVFRTVKGQ